MIDRLAAFMVGEGNWLPLAMGSGFVAAGLLLFAIRNTAIPLRQRILATMNLFTGVMLLILGSGHLLAVTTKLLQGTLRGSAALFYVIGIAVVTPAWFLVRHTRAILDSGAPRTTVQLNLWMAITLVVLGIVNLPLALPALYNLGYSLHRRRWVGWAIVTIAAITCVGLFIGGLIFMASGQTFEEFNQ
ncbi:MAG TPA: hypothetical protein VJ691_01300 [Vicinamibacterales bacterium]|nr:hypothetical protein [Vicinamibacterales bacterium]